MSLSPDSINLWWVSLVLSALTLAFSYVWAFFIIFVVRYKKKRAVTPTNILFIGTFISALLFFLPIYHDRLTLPNFETILASAQHAFRLFMLEGDYREFIVPSDGAIVYYPLAALKTFQVRLGAILYITSPLLTFSFILSFFKNLSAHLRYLVSIFMHAHVFSELNQKSLALANDIVTNGKKILGFIPLDLIIFTDYIAKKDETLMDLTEDAREIGAIIFSKDLESIRFRRKHSLRKVSFYLITEDENEIMRHTEHIINQYDFKGVDLRVVSNDIRTELLLATKDINAMEVTRINDIRALIYYSLDTNGINLFKRARKNEKGENVISVVIIGLGRYGREMLKALAWYCQIPGYKLKINAFDTDKNALEKFKQLCPELMDSNFNGTEKDGEPHYEISIHPGIDVSVPEFEAKLSTITDASYIFVCLGNDALNLSVSAQVRSLCERTNYIDNRKPEIETVIYNSNVSRQMATTWNAIVNNVNKGAKNHKNQYYNILMIGDLSHFYSKATLINSELTQAGWNAHLAYSVNTATTQFAENHMEAEWEDFIKEKNLSDSWATHIQNLRNEEGQDSSYDLHNIIEQFSFLTADEITRLAKVKDDSPEFETLKTSTDNSVKDRKNDWHECVKKKINDWSFISQVECEKKNPLRCLADKIDSILHPSCNNLKKEWEEFHKKEFSKAHKAFWQEYNYNSSITKALHFRLKAKLEKLPELSNISSLSDNEKEKLEHIRWSAYMRTEGFRYNAVRNDLAKHHPDLRSSETLSKFQLDKDK